MPGLGNDVCGRDFDCYLLPRAQADGLLLFGAVPQCSRMSPKVHVFVCLSLLVLYFLSDVVFVVFLCVCGFLSSMSPQLAEYRQRKAQSDGQKKQKKKKKKKDADEEGTRDEAGEQEEGGGGGAPPHTEFTFSRTLRRGETVKHDQHYTIEVSSSLPTVWLSRPAP